MESYIQHCSGATTVLAGSTFDIKQKYSSAVHKRLSQDGTNEIIKEFFDEYSTQVRIVDRRIQNSNKLLGGVTDDSNNR